MSRDDEREMSHRRAGDERYSRQYGEPKPSTIACLVGQRGRTVNEIGRRHFAFKSQETRYTEIELQRTTKRSGKNFHSSGYNVGTKLGTYNGSTCLETFLKKFENCAVYFRWNSEDKLFHLRGSLEGPAGEVLWAAGKYTTV